MATEATENDLVENLSSIDKYKKEWKSLITSHLLENLEQLRKLAFNGDLKVSKFRSVCWSLLLRVLNQNSQDWIEQKHQQRTRYIKLKEEFARNPHKVNDTNDDPLSQSKQSIWNQYFGDQELLSVIKQDVIRTFPGVDFFRKPIIEETMVNILFCYAREHPYMCYRQGMHEILAPILFVLHSDHQALLHFQEIAVVIDPILSEVLNPKYLESDSYFIFSRLMSLIEPYYRIVNVVPNAEGYFPPETSPQIESPSTTEVEVIGQLNFIREKILAKEDLHLHNHLLKLDIPLHIFGIRWLRLLFGREFTLQDLLMLWDAIFADSDKFELPNFIVVAMLIRIRDKLLLSDYTTCLTYLMRYPNNVDIGLILRHALHMQRPQKFERPPNAFIYVTPPCTLPRQSQQNQQTTKTVLPKHITTENDNILTQRTRSASLNSDGSTKELQIQARINEIQYANALNAARLSSYSAIKENDLGVVDGYREDSPEVLQLELQNAQTIMTISRLKLKKYLKTLRENITRNHSDEINQALDGIEELCSFLDVKYPIPQNPLPHPVDQALEANENHQKKKSRPDTLKIVSHLTNNEQTKRLTELEAKKEFLKNFERKNSDEIENSKLQRNQIEINENELKKANPGTRYEIPDNGFMETSTKILGTRRDVELTLFREENLKEKNLGGIPIPDPVGSRD